MGASAVSEIVAFQASASEIIRRGLFEANPLQDILAALDRAYRDSRGEEAEP